MYQYAIFSYIIRCGITDHISTCECMSGFWELISYDQYAMVRYLVKSEIKYLGLLHQVGVFIYRGTVFAHIKNYTMDSTLVSEKHSFVVIDFIVGDRSADFSPCSDSSVVDHKLST